MNDELVEYYYNKVVYYCKKNSTSDIYEKRKDEICNLIKRIIDKKLDYLFKEAYLDYLSQSKIMIIVLIDLEDREMSRIDSIVTYFGEIESEYNKDINNRRSFVNLLDDETKAATLKVHDYIVNLRNTFQRYHYRIYDVYVVIYTVIAYCYINNKMNDFNEIIKYFIDDPYKTLEDLYMNDVISRQGVNIFENYNKLYNRIFNIIDSLNKPKIH